MIVIRVKVNGSSSAGYGLQPDGLETIEIQALAAIPPGEPAARPSHFGSANVVTRLISRWLSTRTLAAVPADRRAPRCSSMRPRLEPPRDLKPDGTGGNDAETDDSACLHTVVEG